MRSFALLITLSILSITAWSASCGTGLTQSKTTGLADGICANCRTINDFAITGAAMLYDNKRFRRVKLANGRNQVEVILRDSNRSLPLSLKFFIFSWNFRATNYAERLIDAVPRRGSVSGAPWNRQPVSTSSLRAKCKEIEAEQEAQKVERTPDYFYNKYRQTDAYKEGLARGHDAYSRWQRMLDWEYILRTKYNSHRTICSPTHSGVRCDRYSRNFNGH